MAKKKILSLLLAVAVLAGILAGCGKEEENTATSDVAFNEIADTVSDTSEIPDWEGKKLSLRVWYAHGAGGKKQMKRTQDVVSEEIERVTGVTLNEETSFENNDELMDAKLGKIVAANDWPDIIIQPERACLDKMIDAGVIYDLTELIPKYCTNLVKHYSNAGLGRGLTGDRSDGKMYSVYASATEKALKYTNPEIDMVKYNRAVGAEDSYSYVYVRDDILKMIYPEAKTQNELEEMYMANGNFTKEEIMDVSFGSKEEFFDFLYKVKDLNLKENGKTVIPFYTVSSTDNWGLLTMLGGLYGYNTGVTGSNYFTYWDKETKQVEYMFARPEFKEMMRDYTKLVQDDVADKEAIICTRNEFTAKLKNGLYAVLYGTEGPDEKALKEAGKDFRYRKVYINVPMNTEKYIFVSESGLTNSIAITNKNIKKEDLPQILRYIDFFASNAGQKLTTLGPKSAGLYTENEDGTITFTDKELEDQLIYDVPNDRDRYYGLRGTGWPQYPYFEANKYNPKLNYNFTLSKDDTNRYFSMGQHEELVTTECVAPNIWEFDGYGVEGVQNFWRSRTTFEEAVKKIFTSDDDAKFEENMNAMLKTAAELGLDDKTKDEINEAYKIINKDNMAELLGQ